MSLTVSYSINKNSIPQKSMFFDNSILTDCFPQKKQIFLFKEIGYFNIQC
jgi:hypothetical protein